MFKYSIFFLLDIAIYSLYKVTLDMVVLLISLTKSEIN